MVQENRSTYFEGLQFAIYEAKVNVREMWRSVTVARNPSTATKLSPEQYKYEIFMVFNICFDVSIFIWVRKIVWATYFPKLQ